ncbi:phage tail family protein [Caldibacillus lycopersici]|uniref:Phage tail family protein n=1 Tax=Perspicuibacillus lycopersici TaxID=1325689 RepID=A0AAE3IUZ6_9BACI|nr:distal tail protein Dit [Perspicuibacillus lycopersici]MCU9614073.1 phage tail family protein [Perspicuibacillus lycopersici]
MIKQSLVFNGITKPYLTVLSRKRSYWAPISRNLTYVIGRPGALLNHTKTDVRVEEVSVEISAESAQELRKIEEDLADWLIQEEEKELIFPDETDRTYYAYIDGSFNANEIVSKGYGTLKFICLDPYKYGAIKESQISTDSVVIDYKGTVEGKPVFRFNVEEPLTNIDVIREDDYFSIGEPADETDVVYPERTKMLEDELETTVGWGDSPMTPDNGVKAGTMVSNGDVFYAANYGNGSNWHGPILAKSLSEPIQDFWIRAYFDVDCRKSDQRARNEVYLLGENGAIIGKLAAAINNSGLNVDAGCHIRNVDKSRWVLSENGFTKSKFLGYVTLERRGTQFKAEYGYDAFVDGKHVKYPQKEVLFQDIENSYQQKVAAVAIFVSKWGTLASPYKSTVRSVYVHRLNNDAGIPYIVDEGDEVVLDFERELIEINGEPRTDLKDFGGNYFGLKKGNNTIVINPSGLTGTVKWRERFR